MNIRNKKLLKSVILGMSLFAGMGNIGVANADDFFKDILEDAKTEAKKTVKDIIGGTIRRTREAGQYEREARTAQRKNQTDMDIAAENREYGRKKGFVCETDIRNNTYGGSRRDASTTNSSSGRCSDSAYAREDVYDVQQERRLRRQYIEAKAQNKINKAYRENAQDVSQRYNNQPRYQRNNSPYYNRYQQVNPRYTPPRGPSGTGR